MKLFLLDAYSLIYRAYYALIRMPLNSNGFNTSAIFGFVNTLEEVLNKENPTHIGVVFDPIGITFRHQLYDKYKAQREKTPDVIKNSLPIIKEIIRAYHISILEISGYEADDVIGTVAKKAPKDWFVYMMTSDKDYGQVVDENIFIYKPIHGKNGFEVLGVKEVIEKYSLSNPIQIIDFLSLVGDKSDNVPGCPGIGEITAKKLISNFGSVENLLRNTHHLEKKLKKKIEENEKIILLSKFLVTIKTDVPINLNLDDLARKKADEFALRKIFKKLEFNQLIIRLFGMGRGTADLNNQPSLFPNFENHNHLNYNHLSNDDYSSNYNHFEIISNRYSVIKNLFEMYDLINKINNQSFFSFGIETIGSGISSAKLIGISFALREGEAYFLPLFGTKEENKKNIEQFKTILEDKSILKIGQNMKYNINILKTYGIRVALPIFDILIAHYLINSEHKHSLDFLAKKYLNYQIIHEEKFSLKKEKNQLTIDCIDLEDLTNYACERVDISLKLKSIFELIIEKENISNLFYQIELPLVLVLSEIEEAGVKLDIIALRESSVFLNQSLKELEKNIFLQAGTHFSITSPKVVGKILFDHLKIIENSKKTKSGQYNTSEKILRKIKNKHPIVSIILKYRRLKKLLTTYVNSLSNLIQIDEKIHTTYNQTTVSTGRLSSTNPNLQNIPIRDEEGKEIRKAFIPEENSCFLSVDYSQIELRIMAHLSGDKEMIESFRIGQDIHSVIAAKVFGIPLPKVSLEKRRKAKIVNFGIIYGISVFGLAEQLQISQFEAKKIINGYFFTFPDIKIYMNKSIEMAYEKGYAETIFHRKRFLPDIRSKNSIVRGYAERNAINSPIQGSSADIIKVAMNRIHKKFDDENVRSKMIMQVHDELNFTVFWDELEKVKQIVIHEMENVVCLKVPLVAKSGIGKNWLEAH